MPPGENHIAFFVASILSFINKKRCFRLFFELIIVTKNQD